jgi:hypothetical protein
MSGRLPDHLEQQTDCPIERSTGSLGGPAEGSDDLA